MARPDPVPITVTAVSDPTPRTRRISFSGMTLVESTKPACYLSLWFSDPSAGTTGERRGRSDKRSFTPRTLDPRATTMTVDFVLHGSGPASTWAEDAAPGDVIWAGDTRGGYDVPGPGSHLVLVGDDTAIPAIATIIEALDESVRTTAILEIVARTEEREITDVRPLDPIWVHRGDDPSNTGVLTMNLLETLSVPDDAFWWIAGERQVMLEMRDRLRDDVGVTRDRLSVNAYWRLRSADPRRS